MLGPRIVNEGKKKNVNKSSQLQSIIDLARKKAKQDLDDIMKENREELLNKEKPAANQNKANKRPKHSLSDRNLSLTLKLNCCFPIAILFPIAALPILSLSIRSSRLR